MSIAGISAKEIKKEVDLSAIMGALSGEQKDPMIIWGLMPKIIKQFKGIASTIDSFVESKVILPAKSYINVAKAKQFTRLLRKMVSPPVMILEDINPIPRGTNMFPDEADLERGKRLIATFNGIINSAAFKRMIILHKDLNHYQNFIKDNNNLEDFLSNPAIVEFKPFHFANLDFKQHIWNNIHFQDPAKQQYILLMFHILWKRTKILVDVYKTPHFNVDEIQTIVMDVIDKVGKNAPELSNCKNAFGIIKRSVGLLKDKMPEYNSECLRAGDPSVIFTSFIQDASKSNGKMSKRTMHDFARIINYFKNRIQARMSKSGKRNDQISKFLDFVEKPLADLEERSKGFDLDEQEEADIAAVDAAQTD